MKQAEMKSLGYVAGYSLTDHIRNNFREQLNIFKLNEKSITINLTVMKKLS